MGEDEGNGGGGMSAADRILVAIPTGCRHRWDDCIGCVFEREPRRCLEHNEALRKMRGVGCKKNQRWVEGKG
jgi:hypothetical protein